MSNQGYEGPREDEQAHLEAYRQKLAADPGFILAAAEKLLRSVGSFTIDLNWAWIPPSNRAAPVVINYDDGRGKSLFEAYTKVLERRGGRADYSQPIAAVEESNDV